MATASKNRLAGRRAQGRTKMKEEDLTTTHQNRTSSPPSLKLRGSHQPAQAAARVRDHRAGELDIAATFLAVG